jgi:hypothetical protein
MGEPARSLCRKVMVSFVAAVTVIATVADATPPLLSMARAVSVCAPGLRVSQLVLRVLLFPLLSF